MTGLKIHTEKKNDVLFVRLEGEIGLSEEYKFRQEINESLKENSPKLVVDLRNISLLSSYGISALVNLWKHQGSAGGSVCVICPVNHVYDSLIIAGTDKLIPIFQEEEQVFRYYQSK